ncbi:MAG: class I SAM-dependent methyltransferase [Acidobacteria bacterium]|nr:class I SAM-dependent methyltransferase [Acidobacteriota bacterium]
MTALSDVLAALAALPADWHAAGCLEMPNLEALARHAAARRLTHSVETGAGKSTLLLSHLSEHHTVFALDAGQSLTRVADSTLLRRERVTFIDGPSQLTLMAHRFTEPIQLAFIDGPHAFPFPNLEYWKLYPHLEAGGLLVVDDIHIPTIRQLFDFLREDAMFTLLETVGKTAFFERTGAETFSPVEDGWWLQQYNTRRFPVPYDDASAPWAAPTGLGSGDPTDDPEVYRSRLLPLIDGWVAAGTRVAIFGIGPHTDRLHRYVPELSRVSLVAYLDSHPAQQGTRYRGVAVRAPEWAGGRADIVLCSSFAHELAQLALMDAVPVKAVLSHPVSAAARATPATPAGGRAA